MPFWQGQLKITGRLQGLDKHAAALDTPHEIIPEDVVSPQKARNIFKARDELVKARRKVQTPNDQWFVDTLENL